MGRMTAKDWLGSTGFRQHPSRAARAFVSLVTALGVVGVVVLIGLSPRYPAHRSGARQSVGAGTISGRVVRPDGSPAPGVWVAAIQETPAGRIPVQTVAKTAVCGADGAYQLGELLPGKYTVIVFREPTGNWTGGEPQRHVVTDNGVVAKAPDLRLARGAALTISVVDSLSGRALEGVYVHVRGVDQATEVPVDAKTDAAGRVRVRVAAGTVVAEAVALVPRASGARPGTAGQATAKVVDGKDSSIVLRADGAATATAVVVGRVVFADGRPAPGLHVLCQVTSSDMNSAYARSRELCGSDAVSGPDGSFRILGLGRYRYNIAIDDKSGKWVAAAEPVVCVPGQTARLGPMTLTSGSIISGTVRGRASGKPVANVSVGNYGPHRPRTTAMCIMAKTDASGRYSLRVAPGDNYVYVAEDGYAGEGQGVTERIAPGETKTIDFSVDARDFSKRQK